MLIDIIIQKWLTDESYLIVATGELIYTFIKGWISKIMAV